MYTFKTNIDKEEYDKFVSNFEYASFMQETSWANVKDTFNNILCGIYRNNKLLAVCSILERILYKGFKIFYIPRGYLIDFENKDLLKFMTENIKDLAKKRKAFVVKIDPNFCVSEKLFKNTNIKYNIYSNNYEKKHNNLIDLGYIHTGFTKDIHILTFLT